MGKPVQKNEKAVQGWEDQYDFGELEDLRQDFETVVGFLVTPKKDDKDPKPTRFVGVVREHVVKGENSWYVLESVANQEAQFRTKDGELLPVKRGDRIGVSDSAAIRGLETKIGHGAVLEFTGKLIQAKKGLMLEVKAKVGKEPVKELNPAA